LIFFTVDLLQKFSSNNKQLADGMKVNYDPSLLKTADIFRDMKMYSQTLTYNAEVKNLEAEKEETLKDWLISYRESEEKDKGKKKKKD
jgi:hypothetical protein